MANSAEFLIPKNLSHTGAPMMEALYKAAVEEGWECDRTEKYRGNRDQLVLYGVGHVERVPARAMHVVSGRIALLWDMGYFGRKKLDGYCRVSINVDHPQDWLGQTPEIASRWEQHGIQLRNDYNPKGHIVLIGLGKKSRAYLGPKVANWEHIKLRELCTRFPSRHIVYRPKPGRPFPALPCATDDTRPIQDILRGASLVVCRHSNVAVDATIAGIPFECEDGAAKWLEDNPSH